VKSIDIKKVKDVFTRKNGYRVRIVFRTKWPRVVLLSTADAVLAEQIGERLRVALLR
jgi:hypothetical protein